MKSNKKKVKNCWERNGTITHGIAYDVNPHIFFFWVEGHDVNPLGGIHD